MASTAFIEKGKKGKREKGQAVQRLAGILCSSPAFSFVFSCYPTIWNLRHFPSRLKPLLRV
jgi:hypothetical protein